MLSLPFGRGEVGGLRPSIGGVLSSGIRGHRFSKQHQHAEGAEGKG
jgi:hypothetical protein